MTAYRWLLFDADNTLFDFDAAEEFALTRTLLYYGLDAGRRSRPATGPSTPPSGPPSTGARSPRRTW